MPFFTLFSRQWQNCPFRVYLGTGERRPEGLNVKVLNIGPGRDWSSDIHRYLAQIPEPHILLCLEDFFFRQRVNTDSVALAYECFCRLEAHTLRLVCRPGPKRLMPGSIVGEIPPGEAYRVSTQAAIWRKETLIKLICPGESIWQFEIQGSRRSDVLSSGFYGVKRDLIPYRHHVVERGKWFPWEAWRFGRMGIGCDFSRRQIMTSREAILWLLRKIISMSGARIIIKKFCPSEPF